VDVQPPPRDSHPDLLWGLSPTNSVKLKSITSIFVDRLRQKKYGQESDKDVPFQRYEDGYASVGFRE
jgi:hypothetical protein